MEPFTIRDEERILRLFGEYKQNTTSKVASRYANASNESWRRLALTFVMKNNPVKSVWAVNLMNYHRV